MTGKKDFKVVAVALCMALVISLVPSMAFAETDAIQEQGPDTITEEYQVVDGQAVKVMHRNADVKESSEIVEMDGYTRCVANCTDSEIVVNGNSVISVTTEGDDPVVQPKGRTRQSTPAYGKDADYTVEVGTVQRNIAFEKAICKLTISVVFNALGAYLPPAFALYSYVAESLIDAAIDGCRDSKISVLKETTYRTKNMAALYNKYVQKWYIKKDDGNLKFADSSVCYDYYW